MPSVRNVLVVGGGAAGCAAAILLARAGVEVDLVEIKPDVAALGSGITVQGNALRVLRQLGVWEEVAAAGYAFTTLGLRAPDGTLLVEMEDVRSGGPDLPATVGMYRPVLARILADAAASAGAKLRYATTVASLAQDDSGVDVMFSNGTSGRYDLVIGADGVRSGIRSLLGIDLQPKPTGMGIWRVFAPGISTLMVDCPGSGEALRLQGLTARVDTEAGAAACVDYLLTRDGVDPAAIGLVGWSLGGYYAPRAAAFEKRLALVVAWGANHDWGTVQRRRLQREGERPVPHYWEHVLWVWGYDDLDAFVEFADQVNLEGVVDKITVPFLICHGENDRQIPVAYAHRSYEQAVSSPRRNLRIFTAQEGATEHIGLDHLPHVSTYIADWVADAFAKING